MNLYRHWNLFLNLFSYNFGMDFAGIPRIFQIELTNYCNLDCIMSPRPHMKRKICYMDLELFKKIIREAKGVSERMNFHHFGESLFHPRFNDFFEFAKNNGIHTCLSTNLSPLTKEKTEQLLNGKLDELVVSFDGCKKETYEKIRRNASFDETVKKLDYLLKRKKELGTGPKIRLQIIQMDLTANDIGQFTKKWSGLVDEVLIKKFDDFGGQDKSISLLRKTYKTAGQEFPCVKFWTDCVVLWDGRVVPCCVDFDGKMVLGDLKKNSLGRIWNSERMKKLRQQQKKREFSNALCKNCHQFEGKPDKFFFLKKLSKIFNLFS